MKVKLKNHFREGLFIFISILGAFALESYRESLLQVKLKDKLLNQLLITLNEDIKHMSEVNAKLDFQKSQQVVNTFTRGTCRDFQARLRCEQFSKA